MLAIILRGVPGSGKSTWARLAYPDAAKFSADDYFMQNGQYVFDPSKLGEAHATCLRGFIDWAQRPTSEVAIVDNTSTTIAEVSPYASIALAYGHDIEIITFLCDPTVAAARNVHGVPPAAIVGMDKRLRDSVGQLMPWWPHRIQDCYVDTTFANQ